MSRTSAPWFLAAFALIGVSTIIEGITEGFTLADWVVIAVSILFSLQAIWILARDRSSQT